jgi:hypothetical protein
MVSFPRPVAPPPPPLPPPSLSLLPQEVNESVKVRVISKKKRVFTTRSLWRGGDKAFVHCHFLVLSHLATQNACFDCFICNANGKPTVRW